jgi:hypothetical protein
MSIAHTDDDLQLAQAMDSYNTFDLQVVCAFNFGCKMYVIHSIIMYILF